MENLISWSPYAVTVFIRHKHCGWVFLQVTFALVFNLLKQYVFARLVILIKLFNSIDYLGGFVS